MYIDLGHGSNNNHNQLGGLKAEAATWLYSFTAWRYSLFSMARFPCERLAHPFKKVHVYHLYIYTHVTIYVYI